MYATLTQFKSHLKSFYESIYDDDGSVDEPAMIEDLTAAAAEIDGAVAARYTVPVTAAAALPILKSWNLILAAEAAFMRAAGSEIPEKFKLQAENVRKLLEKVPDGKFKLAGAVETTTGQGSVSIVSADTPVFNRDQMTGF